MQATKGMPNSPNCNSIYENIGEIVNFSDERVSHIRDTRFDVSRPEDAQKN